MYKLCSQCSNVVKMTQQKEGSPTQIVKQTNKIKFGGGGSCHLIHYTILNTNASSLHGPFLMRLVSAGHEIKVRLNIVLTLESFLMGQVTESKVRHIHSEPFLMKLGQVT